MLFNTNSDETLMMLQQHIFSQLTFLLYYYVCRNILMERLREFEKWLLGNP